MCDIKLPVLTIVDWQWCAQVLCMAKKGENESSAKRYCRTSAHLKYFSRALAVKSDTTLTT